MECGLSRYSCEILRMNAKPSKSNNRPMIHDLLLGKAVAVVRASAAFSQIGKDRHLIARRAFSLCTSGGAMGNLLVWAQCAQAVSFRSERRRARPMFFDKSLETAWV